MLVAHTDTQTWPLSAAIEAFLAADNIGTLTTFRPDDTPHVVPVSFSWDGESRLARIMTIMQSRKARNLIAAPGSRAAICQFEGSGWVTLEGTATVSDETARVEEGKRRYAERYSKETRGRVVVEIAVDRVMSRNI